MIIAATAAVALVSCSRASQPANPTLAPPAPTTAQTTAVGTPPLFSWTEEARDGTLAFEVELVYSAPDLKPEKIAPQGIFVDIALAVTNISTTPQNFVRDYQRLIDPADRLFAPDPRVEPASALVDINPGNRDRFIYVYFDVPKGTYPSNYQLVLHASADSAGVKFKLPDNYRQGG